MVPGKKRLRISNYLNYGLHMPHEAMRKDYYKEEIFDFEHDGVMPEKDFVAKIVTFLYEKYHIPFDEAAVVKETNELLERYKNKHQVYLLQTEEDLTAFVEKGFGLFKIQLSKKDLIHLLTEGNQGLGDFSDEEYSHVIQLDDDAKAYVKELKS